MLTPEIESQVRRGWTGSWGPADYSLVSDNVQLDELCCACWIMGDNLYRVLKVDSTHLQTLEPFQLSLCVDEDACRFRVSIQEELSFYDDEDY